MKASFRDFLHTVFTVTTIRNEDFAGERSGVERIAAGRLIHIYHQVYHIGFLIFRRPHPQKTLPP
jgi:hypothetical protein